jgi:hypothetical protein
LHAETHRSSNATTPGTPASTSPTLATLFNASQDGLDALQRIGVIEKHLGLRGNIAA